MYKNDIVWGHRDRTCPGRRRKADGAHRDKGGKLQLANESKPGVGETEPWETVFSLCTRTTLSTCSHHDIVTRQKCPTPGQRNSAIGVVRGRSNLRAIEYSIHPDQHDHVGQSRTELLYVYPPNPHPECPTLIFRDDCA